MRIILNLFLWSTAFLVLTSCSSGKKALKKGEYDKAVYQAINRLRSNEDSQKAESTLTRAYNLGVSTHLRNIQRAKSVADPLRWESIVTDYAAINGFYDQILRCPACMQSIPNPVKYDAELATARQNAAAARYELGLQALSQKNDRNRAIEAHRHFLRVQDYSPRYKDVTDKLQEAFFYATLKVVVEPIPSPARMFDIRHEFFVNKINEYLHNQPINDYVRFYTPDEAKAQNLEFVDQVIKMQFDQFALGNVFMNKTTKEVNKDSVLLSERGRAPVYGTVKAIVTVHEKAITGNGVLDFKIFDNGLKKVVSQEKFPSAYTWAISWASFNGDERALSPEDAALVNKVDMPVPNPQWMFEEFTAPLYDQVIAKTWNYYRNY
ncbi:MAG: hypothetical protein ACI83W_002175 [Marinoscillum sp.]|jgi:hypothetical protein